MLINSKRFSEKIFVILCLLKLRLKISLARGYSTLIIKRIRSEKEFLYNYA